MLGKRVVSRGGEIRLSTNFNGSFGVLDEVYVDATQQVV
jgi:hypothetical protein